MNRPFNEFHVIIRFEMYIQGVSRDSGGGELIYLMLIFTFHVSATSSLVACIYG